MPSKGKELAVMQARVSPRTEQKKWEVVEFGYSSDVDVLNIYMTHTTPGLIAESVPLDYDEADLFMDVDDQGRVVAIEFLDASQIFACQLSDALTLANKEPFCVRCSYEASCDESLVSFVEPHYLGQKEQELEINVIKALLNTHNRITAIRFARASHTVCGFNSPQ